MADVNAKEASQLIVFPVNEPTAAAMCPFLIALMIDHKPETTSLTPLASFFQFTYPHGS